ncbi:unnamed protein product [Nippostrongylus brasiliensis]|uniref:DUF309 domain-containing protein n=1 Tax=Nippostrongylus brasiliensis TaxID=27835 RepID=A0A0N4YA18_NIPBR|nr:unnamed protein product [Nippostrongylus brasiliensis]
MFQANQDITKEMWINQAVKLDNEALKLLGFYMSNYSLPYRLILDAQEIMRSLYSERNPLYNIELALILHIHGLSYLAEAAIPQEVLKNVEQALYDLIMAAGMYGYIPEDANDLVTNLLDWIRVEGSEAAKEAVKIADKLLTAIINKEVKKKQRVFTIHTPTTTPNIPTIRIIPHFPYYQYKPPYPYYPHSYYPYFN